MLLCGVGLAIVGQVDAAVDDGARAVAGRHAGADLVLRVSVDLADDADRQDEQVRAALADSLDTVSTPWSVDRTITADVPLTVAAAGASGSKRVVTALSVADLSARADLVAGSWAEDDGDVLVQADAADELGVRPGDDVVLGGVGLRVAGTWRARDHLDPRWVGDPQVASGSSDGRFGPVVVAESRWGQLTAEPRAHWVVVPEVADLTVADLDAVTRARGRLDLDWQDRIDDVDSLAVDGRILNVAHEVALRTDGLRAVQPAVVVLLAAVGLVAIAALARLFVTTHAAELSLLWARGAASGALAGSAAVEAATATVVGGALGALAAVGAAHALGRPDAAPSGPAVVAAVLLVSVATAALTALQVWRSTGRTAWRGPSGRAGRLVGPGLVALAVGAAGLAVWQLRTYGSPVTVDADGVPAVDPIAVTAPAALLVALVLLGLVIFPALAARAERRSDAGDVTRTLAARHLSRRLVPVTAPVLVVAIAAATLVTAAAYDRTWSDGFDRTRQLRAGADVHVSTDEPGPDAATRAAVARVAGVRAVAPVATELGGDVGALVAATPAALATLGRGLADRRETAAALTSRSSAPEIPAGAGEVAVELEATGLAGRPEVRVVVADAGGALRTVRLPRRTGSAPGTVSYAAPLPADTSGVAGPRTIAALELGVEGRETRAGSQPRVGLVALTATGPDGPTELGDGPWTARMPGDRELTLAPGGQAPGGAVVVDPGVRRIRLTPTFAPGSPDGPRTPVVLSTVAADHLDLDVGDSLTLSLDGTYEQLQTTVARVVPAVPGAPDESAALVDLRALEQARLAGQNVVPSPTGLWIAAAAPESTAHDLRRMLPANASVDTATDAAGRTALATTTRAWWLGAAGCGLLALLSLVTVARGQLSARHDDAEILRALGMSVRDQQRLRVRELAWTAAFALVVGLLAGAAVAVLVVPQLARAAVPEPYPTIGTSLAVDAVALLAGTALLVGTLAAGIAWYAARVGADLRRGPVTDR